MCHALTECFRFTDSHRHDSPEGGLHDLSQRKLLVELRRLLAAQP